MSNTIDTMLDMIGASTSEVIRLDQDIQAFPRKNGVELSCRLENEQQNDFAHVYQRKPTIGESHLIGLHTKSNSLVLYAPISEIVYAKGFLFLKDYNVQGLTTEQIKRRF